jgi:tetratricopeptide (TPR) repeat protein
MRNANPALARAYELEQRGELSQAIEGYRRLLASEPQNSDALHLLGVALAKAGHSREALEAIAGAAQLQPDNPAIHVNLGTALSRLGRDEEALASFERAVALKPDWAAALHGRGRLQLRLGRLEAAVSSLAEAARMAPETAAVHCDLGVALERLGRKEPALRHFERALTLDPNSAEAHHNRGLLQVAAGDLEAALASFDRALAVEPRRGAIHGNRGNVLADLGRRAEALASYDQALALEPASVSLRCSRGRLLLQGEAAQIKPAQALADLDAALALEPQHAASNFYRGIALTMLERYADALASFDCALMAEADSAQVLNNRGVALHRLGRAQEALQSFHRALRSEPVHLQALTNVANALATLGQHAEALEWFDRALELKAHDPEAAWGKGRLLLSLGEFKQGWPLFEQRLELPHLRRLQRHADLPRWAGAEPINGKTLLVHAEQGLGDTLQFCRYVPLVEARGARVVFEVQPPLRKLLRTLAMQGEIRAFGEQLPAFDLRTPLMSLPVIFGTDLASIPATVPYLRTEDARVAAWRSRLASLPGLKVGIVWQGNTETEKQGGYVGRSFPLAAVAPVANLAGVTLVSLQKGAGSRQRDEVDFGERVLELMDPWDTGAEEVLETSALMAALDFVVTSDTVTAHLAGALGLHVWVLLAANADWRWLNGREDSPWYPSMRLFRQSVAGDWSGLFERVSQRLAAQIQGSGRGTSLN